MITSVTEKQLLYMLAALPNFFTSLEEEYRFIQTGDPNRQSAITAGFITDEIMSVDYLTFRKNHEHKCWELVLA